jgi:hypothetical protein
MPTKNPIIQRTVMYLAMHKPHILKAKGGAWHVAYLSSVPEALIHSAVEYRNNHLERNRFK